jgi:hypothetical protein
MKIEKTSYGLMYVRVPNTLTTIWCHVGTGADAYGYFYHYGVSGKINGVFKITSIKGSPC